MVAARAAAQRLLKEAKTDDERLDLAFRLALARHANGKELKRSREFLHSCSSRRKGAPAQSEIGNPKSSINQGRRTSVFSTESWGELCRALFNLNSFVYVD